ncbi:MAG: alanine racemase [Treponemataceae bacterium]
MRATRALIHLGRLKSNIAAVRAQVGPNVKICVPIKADAYGHGAVRVAVAAIRAGAAYLAVASPQEGIELRESGIVAPILLLSLPIPEELPIILEHRITPLIADAEFAREVAVVARETFEATGEQTAVHLKIDTGMGRIGCEPEDAAELADIVNRMRELKIEGTATHLAVSDSLDADDIAYTEEQIRRFTEALESIRKAGIDPGIAHAANSGGVALHPASWFDMVRPGILVYGYPPAPELADRVIVQPVMELETRIVFLKKAQRGQSISYGRQWKAERETTIATLPVGYADGLPRRLTNNARVLIGDREYPIVGRICMDQCMADLGPESHAKRWDRAVIFGPDPRGPSAEDLARQLETIPYEITCGINRRVPRVYLDT